MTPGPGRDGVTGAHEGPILEARDLVAGYGQIRALKGISFRVEDGQIVALIGATCASANRKFTTPGCWLRNPNPERQFQA